MHPIPHTSLWLGHHGDGCDLRSIHAAEIRALVDLAAEEAPPPVTRGLIYCRFPLVDGGGNDPVLLRAAIDCVAGLARDRVPTLVFCSAGVSRTPVIAAAALARLSGETLTNSLTRTLAGKPADVSPALLREVAGLSTA